MDLALEFNADDFTLLEFNIVPNRFDIILHQSPTINLVEHFVLYGRYLVNAQTTENCRTMRTRKLEPPALHKEWSRYRKRVEEHS